MNTQPRNLLRRLARRLAAALIATAICLGPFGCADIKIDARNLRIPGLTAAGSDAEEEEPGDGSGSETFGDLRCRARF